jgi:hypothetical protein
VGIRARYLERLHTRTARYGEHETGHDQTALMRAASQAAGRIAKEQLTGDWELQPVQKPPEEHYPAVVSHMRGEREAIWISDQYDNSEDQHPRTCPASRTKSPRCHAGEGETSAKSDI